MAMTDRPDGLVIVHVTNERYGRAHERATRAEIARRLAALKGFAHAGDGAAAQACSGAVYLVPSDTLLSAEAYALGIRSEHDLFGGVVPFPFVATKAITHPLVEADAAAPAGWSHDLGRRIEPVVLRGFTAFSIADARCAAARLLSHGPLRLKAVRESGGLGQVVVLDAPALERALAGLDPTAVSRDGVVLEEDLADVITYSIGQVRVADLLATYYGTQRLTPDHGGSAVYGGSDLVVVRGGFEDVLAHGPPEAVRLAIAQAQAYDAAAAEAFPGMIVSRRNYDVAQGRDARGRQRSGVLEQSWRIGGASGAEVAALEAFRADPGLRAVRAATAEFYGDVEPPLHATVHFRGVDEEVGFMTKYALVEPHEHP
jgi:hypothetical protein